MKAFNLAGKVPVTGMNGSPEALGRIKTGEQIMTVYKDLRLSGVAAVYAVVLWVDGLEPFYNSKIKNGQYMIKAHLIDSNLVDKRNYMDY